MNRIVLAVAVATLGFGNLAFADEAMVAAGEKVFKKCKACHAVGESAKNKVGPQLNDLFGRVPGTIEDYKYSKAMVAYGEDGKMWDDELLTAYLAGPKKVVKRTKMTFSGLKKEDDIANIIEYLKTFDDDVAQPDEATEVPGEEPAEEATEVPGEEPAEEPAEEATEVPGEEPAGGGT